MDTALSPPVGQLLGGRYHVDSRIARGGMATVYLGTDTRLDRVIALKIAHPELSDDAEFVRRFIGEARSAARLSSPNVVAIFDQGSDKRLHYIAMEYVPGRTLRQLLNERGRLSAREALDIMAGVLSGLAAAHEAGFAHRDVKPENVLLTPAGAVKVADFGLARSVAGAVQTKGGMIIGTAAYLAPEQVSGGTSDARTDVYAAGIMLFELLTGMQPHTGASPLDVAYKHVNDVVPPPSSVLPGLSGAVDALVAMATSRDPDLRPTNAGQFLRAIQEVKDAGALPGTAPHQAPGYQASGPHGLPGYDRATEPHQGPAAFSGPHPRQPAFGSGPQPGLPTDPGPGPAWAPPGEPGSHPYPVPRGDASPQNGSLAASGPLGRDDESSRDTLLPDRDYEPDGYPGQRWDAGPQRPSGAHHRDSGQFRDSDQFRATGQFRDSGQFRNTGQFRDSGPHGASGRWEAAGAVGASALPSLSPQNSHQLPAPPADAPPQLNHTLVVSDATQLAPYGDLPPADPSQQYAGGHYQRRRSGPRRESLLGKYLFSGRLAWVAGGLAMILVIVLVSWWFSSGRYQKVPTVTGLTYSAASNVLQNQGLHARHGQPKHNPMTKGRVFRVKPARGTKVPSGSTVTLLVSLGPVIKTVPNVSGQPEAAAKAYLRQHGLRIGEDKPEVSSSVPAGAVIGTIPHAYAQIPKTTRVRLIVSEGPGLPNFVGMQVTDAQAAASAGGYTINVVANPKGSEPANTIVSQEPRPDTPITPGEVVTVHYSPGPPTIPVPDVRGMPVAQAIQIMHQAGFRITISHAGPGGTVGDYQPQGDQPKGTVITLTIGVFSGM